MTKRESILGRCGFSRPLSIALMSLGALAAAPATAQSTPPISGAPSLVVAALPASDATPEGLYSGTMTFKMGSATYPVYAIISKDGSARIFVRTSAVTPDRPNGFLLNGIKIQSRGAVFASQFQVVSQPGYKVGNLPLFNGSAGTINGMVKPGGLITGRFMTPHDVGTFSLALMADDYNRAASGELIAGTYEAGAGARTRIVKADGTASGSDRVSRCTVSQKFTIPDSARNVYQTADGLDCRGTAARKLTGYQVYFPKGTGAAWNEGTPFGADTIVSIGEGDRMGMMEMFSKSGQPDAAAQPAEVNLAGLYHGEMTVAGTSAKYPVFAIVLKDGRASMFATTSMPAPDSPQGFAFRGVVLKPSGKDFQTPFTPFTQPGNEVAELKGFAGTAGTWQGSVKVGESITGTYTTPTARGTITLTAMPEEYGRMGSGEDIAGVYDHVFTTRGMQVIGYETILPNGTNVHYDDLLKCPVLQIYTIPDVYHNTYVIENNVACPGRNFAKYQGMQAFFPRGTGAAVNNGEPFTTDTILAITEDNRTGFLKIAK